MNKKLVPRSEGLYEVSPWALSWDDENYYLVGFDSTSGTIKHYRVDKMRKINVTDEPREGKELFKKNSIWRLMPRRASVCSGARKRRCA